VLQGASCVLEGACCVLEGACCVLRAACYRVRALRRCVRLGRLSWFVLPPKQTRHDANDGGRGAALARCGE